MLKQIVVIFLCAAFAGAEIHEHPGNTQELPHDKYIRAVSERDSPVQQVYIKTRDGLYVAAAMRKPKGNGPFPALIYFHGAPGGRGMEQLVSWSAGTTGGPLWERFLKEGYVVVVADYRGGVDFKAMLAPIAKSQVTYVDDGLSVLEYVQKLPSVDASRISVYGVSLGGNLVLHLLGRAKPYRAILGAPAAMSFLGAQVPPAAAGTDPNERWKNARIDEELAKQNIEPIQTPILILVGTADGLIHIDRPLHDLLAKSGKPVRMDIYENGYHDFCAGPQGHPGRKEPLLDSTLEALEKSVQFVKGELR